MTSLRILSLCLLVASLPALGCTGFGTCPGTPCQTLDIDAEAAQPGGSIKLEGVSRSITATTSSNPNLADGTCAATLFNRSVSTDPGASPPSFDQQLVVVCALGANVFSWLADVGDLRDASGSSMSIPDSGGMLTGSDGVTADAVFCGVKGSLELTVDESAGASAAFPTVVTPDYLKAISVNISASSSIPGMDNPAPSVVEECASLASFSASLQFVTAAADVHGATNGTCHRCPE